MLVYACINVLKCSYLYLRIRILSVHMFISVHAVMSMCNGESFSCEITVKETGNN